MLTMALDLVAMKVLPETRHQVKILAAERRLEMWELVRELVKREWEITENSTSRKQPSEE